MSYAIVECELDSDTRPISVDADMDGVGVLFRFQERPVGFVMRPIPAEQRGSAIPVKDLVTDEVLTTALATRLAQELSTSGARDLPMPSLSIAICTKDRAQRLKRLLVSLTATLNSSPFRETEIVVVDNASVDKQTEEVCAEFDAVRYVFERKTGLNFARNTGLHTATGDLLAFLDDDVVVDRHYIEGLARAYRSRPDAGGFSGLVLPFRLDTEAQIHFESLGGFGRGFRRIVHHVQSFSNKLHPIGAGSIGAGCNMAFDRSLVLSLGGFDEALDTGAPMPGGGDLDIFYRVLRTGRPMIYEPSFLVFHEHRETLAQLNRQYWSWGLGFMAFLEKERRHDPELKAGHSAMTRWWYQDRLEALARAGVKGDWRSVRFIWSEIKGGIEGMFGGYDRSVRLTDAIRAANS